MFLLSGIFGSKPSVPKLEKLSPSQMQTDAIAGNQAALPGAEDLVSRANLFSRSQIDQMLAAAGGGSMLSDSASQIDKMVKGELPLSDQQSSQISSVARSFGGGFAGSGSMGNLVARDLGLKTLDVISKGLSSSENWMRTTASLYEPSMINVSSMFLSPQQQYQMQNEQNQEQFQRKWMQNQINAMPDPILSGINAEVMSLAAAYLGGSSKRSDYTQNYSGVQGMQPNNGGGFMDTAGAGMDFGGSNDTAGSGMDFGGMGMMGI